MRSLFSPGTIAISVLLLLLISLGSGAFANQHLDAHSAYHHNPYLYVNASLLWKRPWGSYNKNVQSLQEEIERDRANRSGILNSVICSLGDYYLENGYYDKAMNCFVEASYNIEHTLPKGSAEEAAVKHNMAAVFEAQHLYEMAEHLYNDSLVLFGNAGNRPAVAEGLENLGELYYQQQRLPEAEQALKKSLSIRDQTGDKASANTLNTMQELSTVLEQEGKAQEATPLIIRQSVLREQLKSSGYGKLPTGFGQSRKQSKGKVPHH